MVRPESTRKTTSETQKSSGSTGKKNEEKNPGKKIEKMIFILISCIDESMTKIFF